MPFAPAVPLGGLAGFQFLQRTYDRQLATFTKSPDIQRDIDHFLEKAPDVISAEDITGDPKMLRVVLGAFGLEEDINKQAFIRKVIEEGTTAERAFSKRLVEPAYREMAEFLGIGNLGSKLGDAAARQEIVDRYRERSFEVAAGEVDFDMRLALNFERRSEEIAAQEGSDRSGWLKLLGSAPLRQVIESAFNLPKEFAQIDLDLQVEHLQDRANDLFGDKSPNVFLDADNRQRMVERFLLRQQIDNGVIGTGTRGAIALSLMQSSGLGSSAQSNLFLSQF